MLEQAIDFKEESDSLFNALMNCDNSDYNSKTQFKSWTINDVLYHLHVWNIAASLSLNNENEFKKFMNNFMRTVKSGVTARKYEKELSGKKDGKDLLNLWKNTYEKVAKEFAESNPKKRVKWAGPDMSVRSSITARLMETWSHGQEVFDELGVIRTNTDRIKNIVIIGINTFGWTFINRGLEVPNLVPNIKLSSPSNQIWEWNENNKDNIIIGKAEEFCQVVTQVRNIEDTKLDVSGNIAEKWMSIAQCFAGPPEEPPKKGLRFTRNI
jgi:uncharacterized protein (TIGR03084 family)|tara:strand:- start:7783 stop:8586 length:804 start_codon:yes stop_codon:yes gene_type:complete